MSNQQRLIKLPEVCNAVGLSRSVIYARIQAGTFPSPIKLGKTSTWVEAEVQQWIAAQIAASRSVT